MSEAWWVLSRWLAVTRWRAARLLYRGGDIAKELAGLFPLAIPLLARPIIEASITTNSHRIFRAI